MPLSELYLGLQQRTERTITHDAPLTGKKTKAKTRGIARARGPLSRPEEESPSDSMDEQPTFFLDNRALKVMKTIFYTPSSNANPGEVSWTDFLHAMVSTGFRPEKLYGSVWQFSPERLDVERSIQFHEPHPVAKIAFRNARRIGRRLNQAYGWYVATFLLKQRLSLTTFRQAWRHVRPGREGSCWQRCVQ